jgi:electron transfer flavoprotein beta subunit
LACAWSTGELPEPPNNPQIGMQNMRTIMPALQRAQAVQVSADGVDYRSVEVPRQKRDTRIVKDVPVEDIAREIIEWIRS